MCSFYWSTLYIDDRQMTEWSTFHRENSNGDISATDHPIHSMFGSRVGILGSPDRMAPFRIGTNSVGMWEKTKHEEQLDWQQSKVFLVCIVCFRLVRLRCLASVLSRRSASRHSLHNRSHCRPTQTHSNWSGLSGLTLGPSRCLLLMAPNLGSVSEPTSSSNITHWDQQLASHSSIYWNYQHCRIY